MTLILERHIAYLVRRHDCVVVPGFGAFLCQYYSARFDETGMTILPPGKRLAFNRWLIEDDGLLSASVARASGVSRSEAESMIKTEVDALLERLASGGTVSFGKLGLFVPDSQSGEIKFHPAGNIPGVDGPLYGLLPVKPALLPVVQPSTDGLCKPADSVCASDEVTEPKRIAWFPPQWRAYASGIVATLAVFFTLTFFIMSPIKIDKNTQSASIAPIAPIVMVAGTGCSSDVEENPIETAEEITEQDIDESPLVSVTAEEPAAIVADASVTPRIDDHAASSVRFNENDSYIVVIASFPTMTQAETFLKEKKKIKLGIINMDGRYRVYAATAVDYATANDMLRLVDQHDAWICRK